MAIIAIQARLAANLSQLVVWTGVAAAHRIISQQQQEVIPTDLSGPVRLVMRCAK